MTPKETAKELVERMTVHHWTDVCDFEGAKRCALVAVDAIMEELTVMNYGLQYLNRMAYWNEVKEEIEKL